MRDTKISLLLIISVLSLLLSFGILSIWGYNYYFKPKEKTPILLNTPRGVDSNAYLNQQLYNTNVDRLDSHLNTTFLKADSLKENLDTKLQEFYKLRNEIAAILKDRNPNDDLGVAWQKIGELQQRTDELRSRNLDVEDENKKLKAILLQLTANKEKEDNSKPASFDKVQTEQPVLSTTFTVSDMKLTGVAVNNDKEQETMQSQQIEKLAGSFIVKNNFNQYSSTEVIVVVQQPDGHIVQSSWDAGVFQAKEGKKIYSCKIKFDYTKGEAKRLTFSLSADKYLKGEYTMQVYYNGVVIGKIVRSLS